MALIVCPECGKQISEKAAACPFCGCPSDAFGKVPAPSQVLPGKKVRKKGIFAVICIGILIIAALLAVYFTQLSPVAQQRKAFDAATELYNSGEYADALHSFEQLGDYSNAQECVVWCKYLLGREAYNSNDWETAASYLSDIDYQDSSAILNDCEYLIALEQSVTKRMTAPASTEYVTLVNTELAILEPFRNSTFFDKELQSLDQKYIKGLDLQLSSLTYDYYYEYQRDWNTGLVARYEVLNSLYEKKGFMKDNADFVGEYVKQLSYQQHWLEAFNALEADGHEELDAKCTSSYVEFYLKNNTEYTSDQVFDVVFWEDAEHARILDTVTTTVTNIGAICRSI